MSQEEKEILMSVFEHGPCTEPTLLNHVCKRMEAARAYRLLMDLKKDGFLSFAPDGTISLTGKGRSAVREYREEIARQDEERAEKSAAEAKRLEERLQDRADAERRYHGQNKITIIASLLSFALGLLTEHFTGIMDLVFGFFH